MKSRLFLSITALILLTLFSCKKDDVSKNANDIKMNGEAFSVKMASILGISAGDEGHSGITLVAGSGLIVKTLTIDVESFTKETLAGTYSYPQQEGDKYLDDFLTNYSEFVNDDMSSTTLSSGTVTVEYNGGKNYTVIMDLTMDDGKQFKGTYTGDFVLSFSNF